MATAATMDVRIRDLHRVTSEERAFQSEYNFPPVKCSTTTGSGSNEKEVRWALRGYLPPKHLRIPGYAYGLPEDTAVHMFDELPRNVRPRESIAELMAGCFVPGSERDEGMSEGASASDPIDHRPKPCDAILPPRGCPPPGRPRRDARLPKDRDHERKRVPGQINMLTRFFRSCRFLRFILFAVTVVDTSRTVKGNMSSRPSWGHQAYSMAQQAAQAAGGGAQSVAV